MTTSMPVNPFLAGNFAPVATEIKTEALPVMGRIPPELEGLMVRNGPNPQFPPMGQYHWFDGDGMVHGVQLKAGNATYCNRFIQTQGYVAEKAAHQAIWSGMLEPPQPELENTGKNTANTALIWHANRFLALWEGGSPHLLELPGLETVKEYTFDGKLASAMTAHPKIDPKTGEMFFFGYDFTPPYLKYSVVSALGQLLKTEVIELPVGVMMHDFAITEHYAIFMDLPLNFRLERLALGQPALAFEPEQPSRFGIMPRKGSNEDIRWFEAPACYVFHVLNAYEDGNEVVLLACRMQAFDLMGMSDPQASIPFLYEWRFDLSNQVVKEEQLSPFPCEFPQLNPAYVGRKFQYGYAGKMSPSPMPLFDGIIKFDLSTSNRPIPGQIHELGINRYCGETVFASPPKPAAEDDGWLLTYVHDEEAEQSELLILSAQNLAEPVARVLLPQRVPYGFHGIWVPQPKLVQTSMGA